MRSIGLTALAVLGGLLLVCAPPPGLVQAQEKPPKKAVHRPDQVIGGEEELPLGSHTVEDPSGGKERVYTTGGPSERQKESREQAKEERRLILENLPGIIVDQRQQNSR